MINKSIVKQRFTKSLKTYNDNAVIQNEICNELINLIKNNNIINFNNIYEIGCGTGLLSQKLVDNFNIKEIFFNDIVSDVFENISKIMQNNDKTKWDFVSGDAEIFFPDSKFDLVCSGSTFQWFENPNIIFDKISKSLTHDGIFVFNTFGIENFKEIIEAGGIGIKYMSSDVLKSILEKKFDLIEFKETKIVMKFNSPNEVLNHLKLTGVNAVSDFKWTKSKLHDFYCQYIKLSKSNDNVLLTYNPIYVFAKNKK